MYTCSDALKNRDLVIQPLTETMKLQQSGKRNDYTPYGGLSFRAKQGGNGQDKTNGQTPPRQGDKAGSSNPTDARLEGRYGLTIRKHL